MPDAPWRCSQCGTVNEPVANACRTCGRWPSLFELEGSTLDVEEPVRRDDPFEAQAVAADEVEVEPEVVDEESVELPPEFEEADGDAGPRTRSWRRYVRLIVPIAVALYILVSALVRNN